MSHPGILIKRDPVNEGIGNPRIAAQVDPDLLEVGDPRLYTRFCSTCQ